MDSNIYSANQNTMKLLQEEMLIGENKQGQNYYATNKSMGNKPLSQYLLLLYSPLQPIKPENVE